jgi:hypothetical protein
MMRLPSSKKLTVCRGQASHPLATPTHSEASVSQPLRTTVLQ